MPIKSTDGSVTGKQVIVGEISDGVFRDVRIDTSTRAQTGITYEHHEIHAGSSYHCSDVQNVSTTTLQWMITTPDTDKEPHMIINAHCTGELLVVVTEGADKTGANALAEINHNRRSTNTAGVAVHREVSGGSTDGAITLFSKRTGSTGVGSKTISSSEAGHNEEWILGKNKKYIITVTTYANVYVSLDLDWYEHTAKS